MDFIKRIPVKTVEFPKNFTYLLISHGEIIRMEDDIEIAVKLAIENDWVIQPQIKGQA